MKQQTRSQSQSQTASGATPRNVKALKSNHSHGPIQIRTHTITYTQEDGDDAKGGDLEGQGSDIELEERMQQPDGASVLFPASVRTRNSRGTSVLEDEESVRAKSPTFTKLGSTHH